MIMRRKYLLLLLLSLGATARAQDARPLSNIGKAGPQPVRNWQADYLRAEMSRELGPPVAPVLNKATGLDKTQAGAFRLIGSASNAYTIIQNRQSQVVASNSPAVVAFIHRQNVDQISPEPAPGTTSNGISRIAYSTNGGTSWIQNAGPLNPVPYPNTARARYPQVVRFDPENTGTVDGSHFAWISPATDGTNWGNYLWGNATGLQSTLTNGSTNATPFGSGAKRSTAKFGFLSNNNSNNVLLPGGLTVSKTMGGVDQHVWFADLAFRPSGNNSGTTLDSVLLFRGTYNTSNDSVAYAYYRSFKPPYVRLRSNNNIRISFLEGPNMAFSPDGRVGWLALVALVRSDSRPNDVAPKPILYKTEDGGTNWTGPYIVHLSEYSSITDSLAGNFTVTGSKGQDSTVTSTRIPLPLSFDIVVDEAGNPHMLTEIRLAADSTSINGVKANAATDAAFGDFRFYPSVAPGLWDITTYDGGCSWTPQFVSALFKQSGVVKNSNNQLAFGPYPQISRTEAGDKVFYSWVDDTTRNRAATAMQPNLYGRARDVSDESTTDVKSETTGSGITFRNEIYFPTCAPTVLGTSGTYEQPTVFMAPDGNADQPVKFYYIDDRNYTDAEFESTTRDLEIVSIVAPGENICGVGTQPVTIRVRNSGTSTLDSISVAYIVNNDLATYRIRRLKLASALAVGATLDVVFDNTPANQTGLRNWQGAVPANGLANFATTGAYEMRAIVSCDNDGKLQNNTLCSRRVVVNGGNNNVFASNLIQACERVTIETGLENVGGNTYTFSWSVQLGKTGPYLPLGDPGLVGFSTTNGPANQGRTLVYSPAVSPTAYNHNVRVVVTSTVAGCNSVTDDTEILIQPVPTTSLSVTAVGGGAAIAPVNGKYQVCGAAGMNVSIVPAGNPDGYAVQWFRGPVGNRVSFVASTTTPSPILVTQSDEYTARVTNNNTGCFTEQTLQLRVWNITSADLQANLNAQPSTACLYNRNGSTFVLNGATAATGNFDDAVYRWEVTAKPSAYGTAGFGGNAVNFVRENKNPAIGPLFPNTQEGTYLQTHTTELVLQARPEDEATLNCIPDNAPAQATKTVTLWDSTRVSFTSNIPQTLSMSSACRVRVTNTSTAGITPITHKYWLPEPNNTRLQIADGTLGSVSQQGTDILDFYWENTGTRAISLVTCSAPPSSTQPGVEGCCDTLRVVFTTAANGTQPTTCLPVSRASQLKDFSSLVRVYPNPTSGSLSIDTYFDEPTTVGLEVMDLQGRTVARTQSYAVGEYTYDVNLQSYPDGIYLVRIQTDQGVALKKIVKQ